MEAGSAGGSPWLDYVAGLAAGELRFQRCGGCGAAVFHPRVACPACGGTDLHWERSAGTGTVYSTTTVPVRDGEPYDVSLIDLAEGFRMMARVEGVAPDEVEIGARVWFAVVDGDDGPIAVFRPAGADR